MSMMNEMHIVTTDLPRGLDDAQGSDAFFIIKSLYEKQIRVHLHCFDKQEENAIAPINEICSSINFYERDNAKISLKPDLPYHVSTRSSTQLIDKLNQDELPILFIGLSVSYPIYSRQLKSGRKIAVRLNKNETNYFNQLAEIVPWRGKKIHYQVEAWRMKNYLKNLIAKQTIFFSTSTNNYLNFSAKKPNQFQSLPIFTGLPPIYHPSGKGHFCLFIGRLSNKETAYAANWLLDHVFHQIEIPFVIAGSNPSTFLENAAHVRQHTCLVSNPSDKEIQELIKKAQLIVSPAFIEDAEDNILQPLALGRHVLINPKKSSDQSIREVCHIAQSPHEFCEQVKYLFEKEFSEEEKFSRQHVLNEKFKDETGVNLLINWLS